MQSRRILVTRFSAMGDVAMTIPVLRALSEQFPEFEIVFASQGFAEPLIQSIPRISFFRVDLKMRHKGIIGIWRLANDIKKTGAFYAFADLHDVLRTKMLRILLFFSIKRIFVIDKGRKGKKELTRRNNKIKIQLDHSIKRYELVFNRIGIDVKVKESLPARNVLTKEIKINSQTIKEGIWIGIAPFAKHKGKLFPIHQMKTVVEELSRSKMIKVFLFGGGEVEKKVLSEWETLYPNTFSLVGKINLFEELQVMKRLDLIITMDSANLHMASNLGVPAISIWGATHPYAGFYGWGQPNINAIQDETLTCRPCSVYGNKPCFRKDYACLNNISPKLIIQKVKQVLQTEF